MEDKSFCHFTEQTQKGLWFYEGKHLKLNSRKFHPPVALKTRSEIYLKAQNALNQIPQVGLDPRKYTETDKYILK